MEKKTVTVLVVLGILVVIGVLWYFLRGKNVSKEMGTNSDTINTGGGNGNQNNPPAFNSGDVIYLNINAAEGTMGADRKGIPIYSFPSSSTSTYLVGVMQKTFTAGKPIGTFIEQAGTTQFSKVHIDNKLIWKNEPPTYGSGYITDDYYVHSNNLSKTPY